jgi:hypothetical protein
MQTFLNWSVHLPLQGALPNFPAFTCVPGNSLMYVVHYGALSDPPFPGLSAVVGVPGPDFGFGLGTCRGARRAAVSAVTRSC